jgi:predicted outer membrane repeat protein
MKTARTPAYIMWPNAPVLHLHCSNCATLTVDPHASSPWLFTHQATRPPASRQTGPASGGSGGAIYLGLWGGQVLLYNSTFTNNTATRFGGAVHALAIAQSSVTLDRWEGEMGSSAGGCG